MRKKIYAMGGGSYGKLYDSVECYDPKMQLWTALCPLKERRYMPMFLLKKQRQDITVLYTRVLNKKNLGLTVTNLIV